MATGEDRPCPPLRFAAVPRTAFAARPRPEAALPGLAPRSASWEPAGVPQAKPAQELKSTTQTVKNRENGRSQPCPPWLQAYLRLLDGWAAKYPAPAPPRHRSLSVRRQHTRRRPRPSRGRPGRSA